MILCCGHMKTTRNSMFRPMRIRDYGRHARKIIRLIFTFDRNAFCQPFIRENVFDS